MCQYNKLFVARDRRAITYVMQNIGNVVLHHTLASSASCKAVDYKSLVSRGLVLVPFPGRMSGPTKLTDPGVPSLNPTSAIFSFFSHCTFGARKLTLGMLGTPMRYIMPQKSMSGRSIPCFAIKLEEISPRQCLVQKVLFAGVEEKKFLVHRYGYM